MEKGKFIADIMENDRVEGVFLVKSKHLYSSKNGVPYIALTITDRTGEIEGRIWENAQAVDNTFGQRDFVFVKGDAVSWQGATQIKISDIKRLDDCDVDAGLFMPLCPIGTKELWEELQLYIKKIKNQNFKRLLQETFNDKKIKDEFLKAPAAKRMHHAYLGGLLEHSVSVARLADAISRLYPQLDSDLLIAAAILHDIGKIKELSFKRPPIDYSNEGRLVGHLVLGAGMIDEIATGAGLNKEASDLVLLKHLILSHHGQKEFGTPILPMTEEAVALHLIDDLDAKLNYLKSLKNEIDGDDYGWTEYQRLLERYFYLKGSRALEAAGSEGIAKQEGLNDKGDKKDSNMSFVRQMDLLSTEDQVW
ncbi:MAG: 3'-5' exoribonuclease YhaM family protein [Dissulfurimicrobium sp.]|uniref:3'-5' exoribonuclease YhaM family protein n=1 Tax=Dissulfurimicrobium sp. TaxID=2022436 RepID=UPI003D0E8C73